MSAVPPVTSHSSATVAAASTTSQLAARAGDVVDLGWCSRPAPDRAQARALTFPTVSTSRVTALTLHTTVRRHTPRDSM